MLRGAQQAHIFDGAAVYPCLDLEKTRHGTAVKRDKQPDIRHGKNRP